MRIDHVGYAVRRMEKAVRTFEALGYQFDEPVDDHDRNIRIRFGQMDGYRIELVQPLSREEPSPVDTYLRRVGSMPYHICYRSDAFEQDIDDLCGKGFQVLNAPQPAAAFSGKRVSFLIHPAIGMLELVEE
ncbi:MAG: VOC family protein [Lachnospiraceae bacterium]|nr:VOC family protein [Lachnospiraceae bacterium]